MTLLLGLLGFALAAISGLLLGYYVGGWLLGAAAFCGILAGVLIHLARVNEATP
jgi:hypothetical protein